VLSSIFAVAQPRVQPDPPVRAFYLANVGGGGPVNLVSLGPIPLAPLLFESQHRRESEQGIRRVGGFRSTVVWRRAAASIHRAAASRALVADSLRSQPGPVVGRAARRRGIVLGIPVTWPRQPSLGPNPAVNRTRRYRPSTWRGSARRAGYLDR